ncbi:MAG: DUF6090 family protein [Cyclobacteriaceae bacterium]
MNILKEKRYKEYFVSAIGEMILIIIGILVAFQIDNWNEYRKERKSERLILLEIHDNLKYDLMDFESNINHLQNLRKSSKSLLKVLNDDTPYNDSLGYFFSYLKAFPHFSCKTNGYSLLQSKGAEIILNDTLRNYITALYEDHYKYILTLEKERIDYHSTLLANAMKPYNGIHSLPIDALPKSLEMKGSVKTLLDLGFGLDIRNYDLLKKDEDFKSMLKDVELWSSVVLFLHTSIKNNIAHLIIRLELELED